MMPQSAQTLPFLIMQRLQKCIKAANELCGIAIAMLSVHFHHELPQSLLPVEIQKRFTIEDLADYIFRKSILATIAPILRLNFWPALRNIQVSEGVQSQLSDCSETAIQQNNSVAS